VSQTPPNRNLLSRGQIRRLPLPLVLGTMLSSCALIDATGDSHDDTTLDAQTGDGSGGDAQAGARCLPSGPCYGETQIIDAGVSVINTVVIGQFDGGNTNLDVAVAGAGGAKVFWGDGNGGLGSPTVLVDGVDVVPFVAGRFDNDSVLDLAYFAESGTLAVRVADGARGFSTDDQPMFSGAPYDMVALDFDDDSWDDITASLTSTDIIPMSNRQNATFAALANIGSAEFAAHGLVAGDFGASNADDFGYAYEHDAYVHFGNPDPFVTGTQQTTEVRAASLAAYRDDGAPRDWLAVLASCDPCASTQIVELRDMELGASQGAFHHTSDSFFGPGGVSAAHISSHLDEALVIVSGSPQGKPDILILDGYAGNTFTATASFASETSAVLDIVATGDLNNDGIDDMVVASSVANTLGVILSE